VQAKNNLFNKLFFAQTSNGVNKIILLVVLILAAILVGTGALIFMLDANKAQIAGITTFEQCAAAGYPIMESYPEQCRTPDGRNFVREIKVSETDFNKPITIQVDDSATFPDGLKITLTRLMDSRCKEGVVCIWAGELTFTFSVVGGTVGASATEFTLETLQISEKVIGGYRFTLNVNSATETAATITVNNKNPETGCNFEVKTCPDESQVGRAGPNCEFTSCSAAIKDGCFVGGCSGQICSNKKDIITTCEYKAEYACYKEARCEKQSNGQCGWTQTPALTACITKSNQ